MSVICESEKQVYIQNLEEVGQNLLNKWDFLYLQLNSGEALSQTEFYASSNIELLKVTTGETGICGKLRTPYDSVCFLFQAHQNQRIVINNHTLEFNQIYTAAPGSQMDIRVTGKNHFFALCVETSLIQHNLQVGRLLATMNSLITLTVEDISLLSYSLKNMRWLYESTMDKVPLQRMSEFQIFLLMTKLFQPKNIRSFNELRWKRSAIKAFMTEKLIADSHGPLNVNRLVNDLNINERTLRLHFKDHYGVSVKQYSKMLLLNKVRASIVENPQITVTQHALAYGFEELGRFSADYRKFFGKFPKETRKRLLSKCLDTYSDHYRLIDILKYAISE